MGELLFPIAAIFLTLLIVVVSSALSLAVLKNKRQKGSLTGFGSETTFAWLVAPTLIPLTWLVSSAIHQIEPREFVDLCLVDHGIEGCTDSMLLVGFLVAGIVGLVGYRLWREMPRPNYEVLDPGDLALRRVQSIISADERLRTLKVDVVHHSPEPVYTYGFLKPRVVIDACFVCHADDAMLRAALLHEHAHIKSRDTFRNFLVRLTLAISPLGKYLRREFELWRTAREAVCDREAVHHGGDPLALAEGILNAARFRCENPEPSLVALTGAGSALKLRLALLLHGDERLSSGPGYRACLILALLAMCIPHVDNLGVLDYVHVSVEQLLHL
ncbi:M56 family metallopeptidase [Microvenator marinus]|jgi:beta-lactamase regulating signal transducer with metallopeptidase domain|uniref:M56 family metallopeptidase n=1 Tax=Microvenator marinus TaxID=2600177 RepID=A0A5B8XQ58_9DELT|nr:M56 family metallopeptidase [Microvenator marinus]